MVGTCIANIRIRPAQTAHAAATQLSQAHPGRFVPGLGVGNPDQAAGVGRKSEVTLDCLEQRAPVLTDRRGGA